MVPFLSDLVAPFEMLIFITVLLEPFLDQWIINRSKIRLLNLGSRHELRSMILWSRFKHGLWIVILSILQVSEVWWNILTLFMIMVIRLTSVLERLFILSVIIDRVVVLLILVLLGRWSIFIVLLGRWFNLTVLLGRWFNLIVLLGRIIWHQILNLIFTKIDWNTVLLGRWIFIVLLGRSRCRSPRWKWFPKIAIFDILKLSLKFRNQFWLSIFLWNFLVNLTHGDVVLRTFVWVNLLVSYFHAGTRLNLRIFFSYIF